MSFLLFGAFQNSNLKKKKQKKPTQNIKIHLTLLESNKNGVRDPKKKMKFLTFFEKYTVIVKYRVIYQKREFRGVIYEKERPAR